MTLVVSRRTLLIGATGTAAIAVGTTALTGHLDEALQAAGARPHPEPHSVDVKLAARARADADALVRIAESANADTAVTNLLRAQAAAFPATRQTSDADGSLADSCGSVAKTRARQALEAITPELTAVLASTAAGLDQLSQSLRGA